MRKSKFNRYKLHNNRNRHRFQDKTYSNQSKVRNFKGEVSTETDMKQVQRYIERYVYISID